jgi:hypothetical protein
MPSIQTLNEDVFDVVLHFLLDDPIALRKCAVTCSWMRLRAQRSLFRTCTVKNSAACERLVVTISGQPRLGGYVRELRIAYSREDSRLPFESDVRVSSDDRATYSWIYLPSAYRMLDTLILQLPRVRTLALRGVDLQLFCATGRQLLEVTLLELDSCLVRRSDNLSAFFASFPALRRLRAWYTPLFATTGSFWNVVNEQESILNLCRILSTAE